MQAPTVIINLRVSHELAIALRDASRRADTSVNKFASGILDRAVRVPDVTGGTGKEEGR